jgi:hypothetical protein
VVSGFGDVIRRRRGAPLLVRADGFAFGLAGPMVPFPARAPLLCDEHGRDAAGLLGRGEIEGDNRRRLTVGRVPLFLWPLVSNRSGAHRGVDLRDIHVRADLIEPHMMVDPG